MIKKLTKNKQQIALIFAVLLLVTLAIPLMFGFTTLSNIQGRNIGTQHINDTLRAFEQQGNFNADSFTGNTPQLAVFVENGFAYRADERDNFALFAIIFNPTGRTVQQAGNSIQIAHQHDTSASGRNFASKYDNPIGYHKFQLEYMSSSTGQPFGHGRFIKFRILGVSNFAGTVNHSGDRRYDVSGFELRFANNHNPTDYAVGRTYIFSGNQQGLRFDPRAEGNLRGRWYELDFIRLDDIGQTFYLTAPERNYPRRNMISSVYFSVPQRFIQNYGALYGITSEWYEFQTTPIVATTRRSLFDSVRQRIGTEPGGSYFVSWPLDDLGGMMRVFLNGWNHPLSGGTLIRALDNVDRLAYIFMTENDYIVSRTALADWINNYSTAFPHTTSRGFETAAPRGRNLSRDLFTANVDSGRRRGLNRHTINARDALNLSFRYDTGSFMGRWFSSRPRGYDDILPIVQVQPSDIQNLTDVQVASRFLLSNNDVAAFRQHVNYNSERGRTTYLFRFANTNYYQWRGYNRFNFFGTPQAHSYVVQCTVFLNFDIIDLRFDNGGASTTIPVVMSPIDVVPDIVPPPGWEPAPESCGCRLVAKIFAVLVAIIYVPLLAFAVIVAIKAIIDQKWKRAGIGLVILAVLVIAFVLLSHFYVGGICWTLITPWR
jgi:hypothetical protein